MELNIKRERVLHGLDEVIDSRPLRITTMSGLEISVNLDDYKWIGCNKDFDFFTLKKVANSD